MATVEGNVRISRGSAHDLDSVMTVMNSAFGDRFGEAWTRSQLAGILPMAGVVLVLAREPSSDEILGFSLTRTVADESELLLIAVLPSHHRRGVGCDLLDDFLARARNGGVIRVHLEVREGNPAVAMYRNAGFYPIGRRKSYYHSTDGTRYDAVTLAYEL